MPQIAIEGWIRAKLEYSQFFGDVNDLYIKLHEEFTSEDKETRIKDIEFKDEPTGIIYSAIFGYEEIGVKFSISSDTESKDSFEVFDGLLNKSINGYKNFKKYFLEKIAPKKTKLTFIASSEKMLVVPYNIADGLSDNQQVDLINKIIDRLKKSTANGEVIRADKKQSQRKIKQKIEMLTLKDLEELAKFDFMNITIVWGEPNLFVEHHLFADRFILDDPSLGVTTVAKWGFITSLKLHDINYDLEECIGKVRALRERIDVVKQKRVPIRIGLLKQDLLEAEKSYSIIEDDLREFGLLSSKIIEGLSLNKESKSLISPLYNMRSLPTSLDKAWSIIEIQKLGKFTSYKRAFLEINSDLEIINSRFERSRLLITATALVILSFSIVALAYFKIDISFVASFLEILTFAIAITILLLRFWPERKKSFGRKGIHSS